MLKKTIIYTDFNGEPREETHYFHLSRAELIRLELQHDGYADYVTEIIKSGDGRRIMNLFEDLVLKSYGRRSSDGSRFEKDDYASQEFQKTPAYEALFIELVTDTAAAAAFFNGITPDDLSGVARPRAGKGAGGTKNAKRRRAGDQTVPEPSPDDVGGDDNGETLEAFLARTKTLTREQAMSMDAGELQSKILDGWKIDDSIM